MKTLIELYDERPVENILSTEVFRPKKTVFLCPNEVATSEPKKRKLREFFKKRKINCELVFLSTDSYNVSKVKSRLREVIEKENDVAIDISGGSDAALFAAGAVSSEFSVPTFTYSRRQNRFYNIQNAEFLNGLWCDVKYDVEDCILMAGGSIRKGRYAENIPHFDKIKDFFGIFIKHRKNWLSAIRYIVKATQSSQSLTVDTSYNQRSDKGGMIPVPIALFEDLEKLGFISGLSVIKGKSVKFKFADSTVRAWLRDIGSVLELYIYKICTDSGKFDDVRISAIVDWDTDKQKGGVSNEIDVTATKGICPLFISCKTSEISTEALNELAVLRDRFGGVFARAAIVTTKHCQAITRHRAAELQIRVIDLNDILARRAEKIILKLLD